MPTRSEPSRVAARIQGHPSRVELHALLLADLEGMPAKVSLHSSEPPNPWEGYKRALHDFLMTSKESHCLLLQDDVEVCRDLPRAVDAIAKAKPDECVTLFHSYLPNQNKIEILRALKWGGSPYVRSRYAKFWPVLCVLWPRQKISDFLLWAETARLPGMPNRVASDDAVFGEWGRQNQETLWVTCPSLVEHPDRVPSLIGRRALWGKDRGRCALQWIGKDVDPMEYDWAAC